MAEWPEEDVAAFVAAARGSDGETLMVFPAQKAIF